MNERKTYEDRLTQVQLEIASLKPGYPRKFVQRLIDAVRQLSHDIDRYAEQKGEDLDLEESLRGPIFDARMDLVRLGYAMDSRDRRMYRFIAKCDAEREAANKEKDAGLGDIGEGSEQ